MEHRMPNHAQVTNTETALMQPNAICGTQHHAKIGMLDNAAWEEIAFYHMEKATQRRTKEKDQKVQVELG